MELIKEFKRFQKLAGILKEAIEIKPDENVPDETPETAEEEPKEEPEEEPEESPTPEKPSGTISKDEAKKLIKDTKGKFFTVTFIKKDGTTRVMNARLGVKAYLKGGELPYDADAKGLIPVFDIPKRAYRIVNLKTITDLKIGNNTYKVV